MSNFLKKEVIRLRKLIKVNVRIGDYLAELNMHRMFPGKYKKPLGSMPEVDSPELEQRINNLIKGNHDRDRNKNQTFK